MKFSVPTNWQDDLIPALNKKEIEEVYGKLALDFIGGGRPPHALPQISKRKVSGYIREIHRYGLKFNYLLNSLCLNNKEFTIRGQRKIQKLLDWLIEINVDAVTVSIPYLLQLIKKRYPSLKVSISSQVNISAIKRAKYWQDLGADEITLSCLDVNRNFALLRAMRKGLNCKLRLIANNICLYNCPFYAYHALADSHFSQSDEYKRIMPVGYCTLSCRYRKAVDPAELIRSGWIRPEDIHYYEDIGIDKIKLVDRTMATAKILLVVNAYVNRYYEGNLFDLFVDMSKKNICQQPGLFSKIKYFLHPFLINIFKYIKIRKAFEPMDVFIDNRLLDNFIQPFLSNNCELKSCGECRYCDETAKKVVKFNPFSQQRILTEEKNFLDEIVSGELFKY